MAAKRYNPLSTPNAERWLAEDDAEQLGRVMRSHRREGLDRHEAIHAVAARLMEHIQVITQSGAQPSDDLHDAYFDAVRQLTAEEWLNS